MRKQLVEARKKLHAKAADHRKFLDSGKVGDYYDPANAEVKMDGVKFSEKVKAQQKELKDLREEYARIEELYQAELEAKKMEGGSGSESDGPAGLHSTGERKSAETEVEQKSIGQRFVESVEFKSHKPGTPVSPLISFNVTDAEMKTLMTRSAGWEPQDLRTNIVTLSPQRPAPKVVNFIPTMPTKESAFVYMEETTFTNAAAETAEGGTFPEAALELTQRSQPVQKIAVWLPVTDEQLEDEAQVRNYIDNRLRLMLHQRVDLQVLSGNGTAPNLLGLTNVAGIQTRAKGADSIPDACCRMMTTIRSDGYSEPDVIFMHPERFQDIQLLKTADGAYIWGHPAQQGPMTLFGVPVVQTTAIATNIAAIGDFKTHSSLVTKRGIDMQISNSHDQFFIQGKQAIRLDMRLCVAYIRPKAFGTVTALNT